MPAPKTANVPFLRPDPAPERRFFCTRLTDVHFSPTRSGTAMKISRPERKNRPQLAKT